MPRATLPAFVLVLALAAVPASATQHSDNVTGEDNEFGSIRAPYQLEINGKAVVVEADVVLNSLYEEQKATFFMFAWDSQNSPALDVRFLGLESPEGSLKITEKQGTGTGLEKWFVDIEDLPSAGTPITIRAEIGSSSKGFFSLGAMVVAFNYKWEDVQQSSGDQAKLYAFSQVGVNEETQRGAGPSFGSPKDILPTPAIPALLVVAGVAAAAAALRRR